MIAKNYQLTSRDVNPTSVRRPAVIAPARAAATGE
jgi:hypothetical protein